MAQDSARRKAKLEALLAKLNAGNDVQNRDLRTWLGEAGFAAYEAAWREQLELRAELATKPDAVQEYERRFRDARLLENRADGYAAKGNSEQARRFRAKSEVAYERLLEYVQEQVHADPDLRSWFDRIPGTDPENAPGLTAECMPHAVSSRSLNREKDHHRTHALKSKHAVKIAVLRAALAEYEPDAEQCGATEVEQAQLKHFLTLHEKDPLA